MVPRRREPRKLPGERREHPRPRARRIGADPALNKAQAQPPPRRARRIPQESTTVHEEGLEPSSLAAPEPKGGIMVASEREWSRNAGERGAPGDQTRALASPCAFPAPLDSSGKARSSTGGIRRYATGPVGAGGAGSVAGTSISGIERFGRWTGALPHKLCSLNVLLDHLKRHFHVHAA